MEWCLKVAVCVGMNKPMGLQTIYDTDRSMPRVSLIFMGLLVPGEPSRILIGVTVATVPCAMTPEQFA